MNSQQPSKTWPPMDAAWFRRHSRYSTTAAAGGVSGGGAEAAGGDGGMGLVVKSIVVVVVDPFLLEWSASLGDGRVDGLEKADILIGF